MVVQVVEWEWIFWVFVWVVIGKVELRSIEGEIDIMEEVHGMDDVDISIEDSEGMIEDMADLFCKDLANLVSKIGFEVGIEMSKVSKTRVFSNYFEIVVHNPEIED